MAKGKAEIVAEVAEQTGQPQTKIAEAFDAIVASMVSALRNDERIELRGFCTLRTVATKARMGRNPRTGVEAPIAAGRRVAFKPSRSLLD